MLGPNGAGKTTLMKTIATLLKKKSGEVLVCGVPVEKCSEIRGLIGYLPQDFSMYGNMNAYEALDYLATLSGMSKSERKKKVPEMLEKVNLWEQKKTKVKAMSGGMKRRLGIAQSLIHNPKVIIVDEPTAGLDPEERVRFRNLLCEIAKDRIVLLSTHIVGDIEATCEEIAVLNQGEIVFRGTVRELLKLVENKVYTVEISTSELEKVKKERESENLAKSLDEARRNIKIHLKENSDNLDPVDPKTVENYELPRALKKGDEVVLVSIGQKGVLLSDPDKSGNVQVQAGIIKTKTNIKNLMLIDGVKVTFTDKNGKKGPAKSAGDRAIAAFNPEIDLRGNYGDDACFLLDKYIDDALRAGVKTIRIVHGKGTGVLRSGIHMHLKRHKAVKTFRLGVYGEGESGVTVVELK